MHANSHEPVSGIGGIFLKTLVFTMLEGELIWGVEGDFGWFKLSFVYNGGFPN